MSKPAAKGSVEWFEQSRFRCVDHLRALLSLRISLDNARMILLNWKLQNAGYKSALHSSCVISYARPFTNASTKNGNIKYPIKQLIAPAGFDKELHTHILDFRNRLIAHSDYGVFPSTMYLQVIGDERLPLTLGINVMGLFGIESFDMAVRYEKHISICCSAIEQILNLECKELASEARIHPSEFNKTHNIPETRQEISVDQQSKTLPGPTGPAAGVENPSFGEGLSRYQYITLTHQIPLVDSGTYIITDDGVTKEITLSVE